MTNSKMIKILSVYEDRCMFAIIDVDKFDFDENIFVNEVREKIFLSDIIAAFEKQSGLIYEELSGKNFKDLIKMIESGRTENRCYKHYADSAAEFRKRWTELHPHETYEQYLKNQNKKPMADFSWTYGGSDMIYRLLNNYNDMFKTISNGDYKPKPKSKYHN